jgi:hypothetical protein
MTQIVRSTDPAIAFTEPLFIEIMTCLDSRSIQRSGCVSKLWNKLLNGRLMSLWKLGYNLFARVERPIIVSQKVSSDRVTIRFKTPITKLTTKELQKMVRANKAQRTLNLSFARNTKIKESWVSLSRALTFFSVLLIVMLVSARDFDNRTINSVLLLLFQFCYKSRAVIGIGNQLSSNSESSYIYELILLAFFRMFEEGFKQL